MYKLIETAIVLVITLAIIHGIVYGVAPKILQLSYVIPHDVPPLKPVYGPLDVFIP